MKRVLFVCTGNTCRSPLAEGLLRLAARARGVEVEVRSAGVAAMNGSPISTHAAAILTEKGSGPEGKTSEQLSAEHVAWADLILTMTMNHKRTLIHLHPSAVEKTYTLKEFANASDERLKQQSAERARLIAELETKKAMGEPVAEAEIARIREMDRLMPSYDVNDPFGGSELIYRQCADEIEAEIAKILDKRSDRP